MIARLSSEAERALASHFRRLKRPEAIDSLRLAIVAAQQKVPQIERHRPAPRPYPELALVGVGWLKSGQYRISYSISPPRRIIAIHCDRSDIPARIPPRP